MSLCVVLDPEAEEEYEEGYNFYESRLLGLGDEFSDAVEAVLDRIGVSPQFYRKVYRTRRRAWLPLLRLLSS